GISDVPLTVAYGIIIGFIGLFYSLAWYLIHTGRGLRT
ncbi:MAG: ABC transporter permease, partial [Oceanospirillales bacterium]|nr:ABC transporter permease [Oceanospirillales bacterium]